eukprot:UN19827
MTKMLTPYTPEMSKNNSPYTLDVTPDLETPDIDEYGNLALFGRFNDTPYDRDGSPLDAGSDGTNIETDEDSSFRKRGSTIHTVDSNISTMAVVAQTEPVNQSSYR